MKGVVLAGGSGSRLYPLTKVTNKHLLPVGDQPMIYHPIHKLVEAGITDILVVTGVEHMGAVVGALGSGRDFGASFTYKVQDAAGGIAEALGLARDFCGQTPFVTILGDNIFEDSLIPIVARFLAQNGGARLLLKAVDDPRRFGCPEVQNGKIIGIEEKPKAPKSHFAVTGIYFYDASAFTFIDQCTVSQRGELEITDVNNFYIEKGHCFYDELDGWWTDAGTMESLFHANVLVRPKGFEPMTLSSED